MAKLYDANLDYLLTGETPPNEKEINVSDEEYYLIDTIRKLDDFTRGKIYGIIETSIKNKHPV